MKRDKVVAFMWGDGLVTLYVMLGGISLNDLGHFGLKVAVTLFLGVVGGIAGMLGKDIYQWAKRKRNKVF